MADRILIVFQHNFNNYIISFTLFDNEILPTDRHNANDNGAPDNSGNTLRKGQINGLSVLRFLSLSKCCFINY